MNQRKESGADRGIVHWLIHQAARRAPPALSERLEEEWLADLAERRSALSRLRFALGCCWATGIIAFERLPTRVPAAATVADGKFMGAYAEPDEGYFSGRSGTLLLVAALHAILLYGLVTAVTHIHVKTTEPLQNRLLDQTAPKPLPLSIPQPTYDGATIHLVTPELAPPPDLDPTGKVTTAETPPQTPDLPSEPVPPHVATQVQGGPGPGFPNPDDYYPPLARYSGEQGVATVKVCVDTHGRLTSPPVTLQGSGSSRLDQGALKLAREASGHYRATTEDGRPIDACYPLRIRFQIRN